jgi:chromosome segregation protein
MVHEQSLDPLRERITKLQLEEQAAQLGGQQYLDQLREAAADLDAIAASIAAGPGQARRPAGPRSTG